MDTMSGQPNSTDVLISPKSFRDFGPEEFHKYVTGMYALRVRGSKPAKPVFAEGLTVSKTKSGKLSVRRTSAKRAFAYVTRAELSALSTGLGFAELDLWNAFKAAEYIIAQDRMDAEKRYAEAKGVAL